jgi:hypothetical protein
LAEIDVENPINLIKNHSSLLKGVYVGYEGNPCVEISSKAAGLYVKTLKTKFGKLPEMGLIPMDINSLTPLKFFIPMSTGGKYLFEFKEDPSGQLWLYYDRYKLKKSID